MIAHYEAEKKTEHRREIQKQSHRCFYESVSTWGVLNTLINRFFSIYQILFESESKFSKLYLK